MLLHHPLDSGGVTGEQKEMYEHDTKNKKKTKSGGKC